MSDSGIPFLEIGSSASFHIRPILRHVDPIAIDEPPHRHNFQELIWIKSGSGTHKLDEQTLNIKPLTFYLIAKGQVHYFTQGIDLDGYVIRFTDDFLLDETGVGDWDYRLTLFNHFAVHHSLTIALDELRLFEGLILRMEREQEGEGFGRITLLRHLLSILLIQLERTRRKSADDQLPLSANATIYQAFLTDLERDFKRDHHVQHYADLQFITPRQLSGIVRRFSGKTAKQQIQERLMLEARRLLQHTNASVKEVAFSLGFQDPSYFSKVFKNATGVSPHAYKATL
ncbi:MAG: AraC family transcriptional regulator [Candidatus Promineifilaceae bacterium]